MKKKASIRELFNIIHKEIFIAIQKCGLIRKSQ